MTAGAKAVSDSHPDSFREFDKENAERSGTNKENTKKKKQAWTIDDFEIGSLLTLLCRNIRFYFLHS